MNLVDFKFLFQERNPALRQSKRSGHKKEEFWKTDLRFTAGW